MQPAPPQPLCSHPAAAPAQNPAALGCSARLTVRNLLPTCLPFRLVMTKSVLPTSASSQKAYPCAQHPRVRPASSLKAEQNNVRSPPPAHRTRQTTRAACRAGPARAAVDALACEHTLMLRSHTRTNNEAKDAVTYSSHGHHPPCTHDASHERIPLRHYPPHRAPWSCRCAYP
jgi:hypothetical protein